MFVGQQKKEYQREYMREWQRKRRSKLGSKQNYDRSKLIGYYHCGCPKEEGCIFCPEHNRI